MSLLLSTHPFPDTNFGLWHIAEDETFFSDDLPLSPDEALELSLTKGMRRLEWLAARWLLHKISGVDYRLPLAKNAFSKPFFPNNQDLCCSFSHSHGVVGAFLGRTQNDGPDVEFPTCGCDIQVFVEKIQGISHKFVNFAETAMISAFPNAFKMDLLHVMWTAKESLYKAYGLKALDFKTHMHVKDLTWNGKNGRATGMIDKPPTKQYYHLLFEQLEIPDGRHLIWTVCIPQ